MSRDCYNLRLTHGMLPKYTSFFFGVKDVLYFKNKLIVTLVTPVHASLILFKPSIYFNITLTIKRKRHKPFAGGNFNTSK